ncbi:MAG: response regulator transcription factor [Candidatus Acidiferrum sp.]
MRVLIADDHEIVRRGVRAILESRENIEIIGEAVNGREAVNKAAALRPDLIVMDHSMPELDGLEAAIQIRQILPKVPILILSMHEEQLLVDALRLVGAQGFVPKAECANRLLEGVDALIRGELFFKRNPSTGMGLLR